MRSWQSDLSAGLRDLLTSGEEADFTLTCTDGDLKCHRVILLASGGALRSRVRDRLADNVSRLDLSKLELSCEQGKEILLAVYGGVSPQLVTEENVPNFVHFALHFDLKWLMTEVIERFEKVLTPKNVLKLLTHNEISGSTHMSRIVEDYCYKNLGRIVSDADFVATTLDAILMLGKIATSDDHENYDCYQMFEKVVSWILSKDENLKSSSTVLSLIPLKRVPKGKLQTEVYDMIFNRLIIDKGEVIPQQDKVILSSLYQEAVRTDEIPPLRKNENCNRSGSTITRALKPESESEIQNESLNKSKSNTNSGDNSVRWMTSGSEKYSDKSSENMETDSQTLTTRHEQTKSKSIMSYIARREWSNMEVEEVQRTVEQEDLLDTEFLIVESILVWIAADPYRRQHCERLLRACRFSALCPVYIRAILTTFITEKMVGSGRLTSNILRSPSSPRPGSAVGRLAGVCDDVPLSVQRLELGDHLLQVKCGCGGRGQATLSVLRDVPTATVKEMLCRSCGTTKIVHTACSSTLTPDIFPSMHLLPFNHLARLISSMDDIRVYIFK